MQGTSAYSKKKPNHSNRLFGRSLISESQLFNVPRISSLTFGARFSLSLTDRATDLSSSSDAPPNITPRIFSEASYGAHGSFGFETMTPVSRSLAQVRLVLYSVGNNSCSVHTLQAHHRQLATIHNRCQ